MNIKEIIGRTIIDILVWSKMEVGGLDEAEVSISLDNNKIIGIPWNFETMNINNNPKKILKVYFMIWVIFQFITSMKRISRSKRC